MIFLFNLENYVNKKKAKFKKSITFN